MKISELKVGQWVKIQCSAGACRCLDDYPPARIESIKSPNEIRLKVLFGLTLEHWNVRDIAEVLTQNSARGRKHGGSIRHHKWVKVGHIEGFNEEDYK